MLQPTEISSKGASLQSKVDNLESHFSKGPDSVAASKQRTGSCRKKSEARGDYLCGTSGASLRKTLPLNVIFSRSVAAGVLLKTRPAHMS